MTKAQLAVGLSWQESSTATDAAGASAESTQKNHKKSEKAMFSYLCLSSHLLGGKNISFSNTTGFQNTFSTGARAGAILQTVQSIFTGTKTTLPVMAEIR